ncbi:MAG: hypothetical protein H7837_01315 [Magnetococcus sp. MYC-9]
MANRLSNSKGTAPLWSLTFANVALLLLAVFAALLSVSHTDSGRATQLIASLHKAFGVEGVVSLPGGASTPATLADPVEFPQKLALLNQISPLVDSNKAEVETTAEGFVIRIAMDTLFVPDSLLLRPDMQPRLRVIANLLAGIDNLVQIAGYTEALSAPEGVPPKEGSVLSMAYSLSHRGGKAEPRSSQPGSGVEPPPGRKEVRSTDEVGDGRNSASLAYASVVVTFLTAAGGVDAWRLQSKGQTIGPAPRGDGEKASGLTRSRRIELLITRETLPTVKPKKE